MAKNREDLMETIKNVVADKYDVKAEELTSSSKTEKIVFPRQIAMFLACELMGKSPSEIAIIFNRDVSIIMFAHEKIKKLTEMDPFIASMVDQLKAKILDGPIVTTDMRCEVISTSNPEGVEETDCYYNIIDYAGDMSDHVMYVIKHQTLESAVQEARKFTLDRCLNRPEKGSVSDTVPPRMIRTVKFVEMHRVDYKGPLPKGSAYSLRRDRIAEDD
ncbi:MAG: hypothetical protein A2293_06530 [Elusimicrobia bacterium RIFOXYB2_FULL_49_7]|nr:MAG: hypothetical protein A2293_06530 [Elusimicrobia bacterium RIFOXYB2_FULL_49_7]